MHNVSSRPKTRDSARYHELSAVSNSFREWLNMSSGRRASLRGDVRKRDGDNCFYCFKYVDPKDENLCHLLSLFKGGTNDLENLVIGHSWCNRKAVSRGNKTCSSDLIFVCCHCKTERKYGNVKSYKRATVCEPETRNAFLLCSSCGKNVWHTWTRRDRK
jgi:5-methylcytosine-specific restriction endonuclease McrA